MTPVRAIRPDRDTKNFLDGNTQGMGLIVLEAALALAVLVFLIWWTMFSGRRDGELHGADPDEAPGGDGGDGAGGVDGQAAQPPERGGTRKDIG